MRWDVHLLFAFVAIGLVFKRVGWKGWFAVAILIATWMCLNLIKGLS
jgi:hypothetical protein